VKTYRLSVVIPLTLCLFSAIAAAFFLANRLTYARSGTLRIGRDQLATVMLQLQDSVSASMANGNTAAAQQAIAIASLDPIISRILLVDDAGKALIASESSWRGRSVSGIPGYDTTLAKASAETDSSRLSSSDDGRTLRGYYPVSLQPIPGALQSPKGILFVVADLTVRLQEATHSAYVDAGYLSLLAILSALTIGLVLHFTVARGVNRLFDSFAAAAPGDLTVRSGLSGKGELARLGASFDAMTEQLAGERQALRLSEEHYRSLFDSGNDPVYICDLDGNILEANDAACRVMGRSRDEFLAMTVVQLDAPDQSTAVPVRIAAIAKNGTAVFETEHVTKGGTLIPMEVSSRLMDYGDRSAILSVCRDISARRQAERERTRLLDVLDRSLNEIYMFEPETLRFTYVNAGARKNLGYTLDELEEMSPLDIKPSFTEESFRDMVRPLVERRQEVLVFETLHRRADGSTYPVEVHLQLVEDRGSGIFLAVINDITERKRIEAAASQTQEYLRATVEQAAAGIARVSLDGRWLDANDCLCEMLGYSVEELRELTFSDITFPDDSGEDVEAIGKLVRGEIDDYHVEKRYIAKDGRIVWVDVAATLARDIDGEPAYTVAVTEDITKRKQSEAALLVSSERLEGILKSIVATMGKVVETRDPYTQGHQVGVARLGRLIAEEMGLADGDVDAIEMAALVHDIGKLSVPAEILTRPGMLSAIEFALIKQHSQAGYEILKDIDFDWPVADIVLQHHERMDGSGYPRGLKGEDISMPARILAVTDVIEAMASHRPYRPALGLEAAIEEIENSPDKFDPQVIATCVRLYEAGRLRLGIGAEDGAGLLSA
jgi:PAS domain S-box-containing protein/putative nucleotidyltransferase with HDIG domain